MDTYTYTLFRNNKRISLRDEDMNRSKIGLIFQVVPDSIFLGDDRNTAVFADGTGTFDTLQLTRGGHYEVNGDSTAQPGITTSTTNALPQAGVANVLPIPQAGVANVFPQAPPQATPRFMFAQRQGLPNSSQANPTFSRRTMSKSFGRSVQLVEAVGSSLNPIQTIFLRLGEHEANVGAVAQKVAEQLDMEEDVIIVDSKGQEIHDGAGTQGATFWKTQTRKIYCMAESAHLQFLAGRRNKHRRRDNANATATFASSSRQADMIDDQTDAIRDMTEATNTLKKELDTLQDTTSSHILVRLTREQDRTIREAFTCVICKGPMKHAMFATCCRSLLACQRCFDTWYVDHDSCPKCRQPDAKDQGFSAAGLTEALETLATLHE